VDSNQTKDQATARIPALDGLRGIAILLVLLWHGVFAQYSPSPLLTKLLSAGKLSWSGVDLFFVLSGFLIGGILLDAREAHFYFRAFYLRRVCRILPLYLLVVSLYLLCYLSIPGFSAWLGFDVLHIPAWTFFLFVQNFWMVPLGQFGAGPLGITWSLAIEEQFYLTVPWIIRKLSGGHLIALLLSVVIAAPVLRTLLFFTLQHGGFADYVLMPCRADALCMGVLCSVLLREPHAWTWIQRKFAFVGTLGVMLLLALVWLSVRNTDVFSAPMVTVGYSLLALFYSCGLLAALAKKPRLFERFLTIQPLRQLGKIAYCVYLIHYPMLRLGNKAVAASLRDLAVIHHAGGISVLLGDALGFAATLFLACLSWRFLEQPALRRGHRYRYC
jgi:peptidoglycan/LPS O-acetylase OafA/YrhL